MTTLVFAVGVVMDLSVVVHQRRGLLTFMRVMRVVRMRVLDFGRFLRVVIDWPVGVVVSVHSFGF